MEPDGKFFYLWTKIYYNIFFKRPYVRISVCHPCWPIRRRNKSHRSLQQLNHYTLSYLEIIRFGLVGVDWVSHKWNQVPNLKSWIKEKNKWTYIDVVICHGTTLQATPNFSQLDITIVNYIFWQTEIKTSIISYNFWQVKSRTAIVTKGN